MNDVERELRRRFVDTEHRLTGPDFAPTRASNRLLERARRRQVTVALMALATVVIVAMGSIAGVSALLRTSERRVPTEPPDTFSPGALEAVAAQPVSFAGLVADAEGRLWSTWPVLTSYDPLSGSIRTFTKADDPRFAGAGPATPAIEGGVWLVIFDGRDGELGVARFDGERFVEISAPVPTDYLGSIAQAPDGTVWVGGNGVFAWDGSSWRQVPNDGRPEAGADTMTVDVEGGVWVQNSRFPGPEEMGLSRFDGSTWTTWTTADGLPSNAVYAGDVAPNGDVWIGTNEGVGRFADGSWSSYSTARLGLNTVRSVAVASDGTVWVGGDVIARFDGTTWSRVEQGLTGAGGTVVAAGNRIWAVVNGVLLRWNGETFIEVVKVDRPQGTGSLLVAAGADELWMGGSGAGGTWRLIGDQWMHFDESSGMTGELRDLARAPDGTVWAATSRGLWRFAGARWEQVDSGDIATVGFGPDGAVWMASGGHQDSTVHVVGGSPLPGTVPIVAVNSLAVASADDVWAGSSGGYLPGGLAHFDGRTWTAIEPIEGDKEFGVIDLQLAPSGDVWVSLVDYDVEKPNAPDPIVVARFDGSSWDVYREFEGIPFTWAFWPNLDIDPDGRVLLATNQGLLQFRQGGWRIVQEGSFDDISIAPNGTIWLAGDGLFRLPPA